MTPGPVLVSSEQPEVASAPSTAVAGHRTWNRFELKYLVPVRQLTELRAALAGYVKADAHGGAAGYRVYSVYWDSPGFRFFWEKIDGERVRRKLRFRTYGNSDVFIEIKQRIDRTVQKRRASWPLERVSDVLDRENGIAEDAAATNPVVSEMLVLTHRFSLRPVVAVAYRRAALMGVFEPELRITFDTRVQFSTHELDIGQPFHTGKYMVDPRLAIMEVKFNHHIPVWLTRVISRFGLSAVRISKYCSAVDIGYYHHQFT